MECSAPSMSPKTNDIRDARIKKLEQAHLDAQSQLMSLLTYARTQHQAMRFMHVLGTQLLKNTTLEESVEVVDDLLAPLHTRWAFHHTKRVSDPSIQAFKSFSSHMSHRFLHDWYEHKTTLFSAPSQALVEWCFARALPINHLLVVPNDPLMEQGFLVLGFEDEDLSFLQPFWTYMSECLHQLLLRQHLNRPQWRTSG